MNNLTMQTLEAEKAWRQAGIDAQFATNQLFRTMGYTMPDGSGGYTTGAAANAFNPENLTGGDYKSMINNLQVGGTGALADIYRGGAGLEQQAIEAGIQRNIAGGGLAAQTREAAQTQTQQDITKTIDKFTADLGSIYGNYGSAAKTYTDTSRAISAASAEELANIYATDPTAQTQGSPAEIAAATNNRPTGFARAQTAINNVKTGKVKPGMAKANLTAFLQKNKANLTPNEKAAVKQAITKINKKK